MDSKPQTETVTNIPLCPLEAIPDGGAITVDLPPISTSQSVILLRAKHTVWGFINRCPHQGTPLETFPNKLLDKKTGDLVCSTHGARFSAASGLCIAGPCRGAHLRKITLQLEGDSICLMLRNNHPSIIVPNPTKDQCR